jgi:hypothetical protein
MPLSVLSHNNRHRWELQLTCKEIRMVMGEYNVLELTANTSDFGSVLLDIKDRINEDCLLVRHKQVGID